MASGDGAMRCPVCGRGTLVTVAFDEPAVPGGASGVPRQRSDSKEADAYSCGHEVVGPSLATADSRRLAVERRRSEETVEPVPDGGGA